MVKHGFVLRLRRGLGMLGCLTYIAVIGLIVYAGYLVGDDALAYYRFRDAMKQEARFAGVKTDEQIRAHLRAFTDSVKLPEEAKEVSVVREGDRIRIWSQYDAAVHLPLNYTRVFRMRPSVEQKL